MTRMEWENSETELIELTLRQLASSIESKMNDDRFEAKIQSQNVTYAPSNKILKPYACLGGLLESMNFVMD